MPADVRLLPDRPAQVGTDRVMALVGAVQRAVDRLDGVAGSRPVAGQNPVRVLRVETPGELAQESVERAPIGRGPRLGHEPSPTGRSEIASSGQPSAAMVASSASAPLTSSTSGRALESSGRMPNSFGAAATHIPCAWHCSRLISIL